MKKLLFLLVAVPFQVSAMQPHKNRLPANTNAQAIIEIDSDSESSVEEVAITRPHVTNNNNKSNHSLSRPYNAPLLHSRIARIQQQELPHLVNQRTSGLPVETAYDASSTYAKNLVDQKLAHIDCCGLSLGNWARGLNHVMLAHKRNQQLFTCSKCNKLFESAPNALACVAKHDDPAIFTCPICMVDCVMHDAFLKHVCPAIKTEIKSEPITHINNDFYNGAIASPSALSNVSEPDRYQNSNQSAPLTPLSAMFVVPQTPDTGYVSSPITNASSVASEMIDSEDHHDDSNAESLLFDPAQSVEKNINILRKIITKRIEINRYQCCDKKDLSWQSFCQHIYQKHKVQKNKIKCPVCNTILPSYSQGYEHIASHTHQMLFSCPLSVHKHDNKMFQTYNKKGLIHHFRACFNKQYSLSKKFVCDSCGLHVETEPNLTHHYQTCKQELNTRSTRIPSTEADKIRIISDHDIFANDILKIARHTNQQTSYGVAPHLLLHQVANHETSDDVSYGFNNNRSADRFISPDQFIHALLESDQDTQNVVISAYEQAEKETNTHMPVESPTKKNHDKTFKIANCENVLKRKELRRGSITVHAKEPVIVEGQTFDAQGDWNYNLVVLKKLINARLSGCSFACCKLQNLTWQAFCDHQKEYHRKSIDGADKVVCPICDKSHRTTSYTHEHTATHQYPRLFSCPVCDQNNKYTYNESKENLVKHFEKCFAQKYPSAHQDAISREQQGTTIQEDDVNNTTYQTNAVQMPHNQSTFSTPTVVNPLFDFSDHPNNNPDHITAQNDYYPVSDAGYLFSDLFIGPNTDGDDNLEIVSNNNADPLQNHSTDVHNSIEKHANSKKRNADEVVISTYERPHKKQKSGQISNTLSKPVVIERQTFDAAGNGKHNRAAFYALIQARIKATTFTCCDLKNITFQALYEHQKEKHRALVNGLHKLMCNQCGKRYTSETMTLDHIAQHQKPHLFCCPVCVTKDYETRYTCINHFKNCFNRRYGAEQEGMSLLSCDEEDVDESDNYFN